MTQEMQIADYERFIPALHSVADQILTLETEVEQAFQPALF
jgi:hypothetical protein